MKISRLYRVSAVSLLCLLIAAPLMLEGCGGEDGIVPGDNAPGSVLAQGPDLGARPEASGRGAHNDYPLVQGTCWSYEGSLAISVNGGEPTVNLFDRDHWISGTEELMGREYVVESQTVDGGFGGVTEYWIRYRQDRDGLYEADYPITTPPGGTQTGSRVMAVGGAGERWLRSCSPSDLGVGEEMAPAFIEARQRLIEKLRAVESLGLSSPSALRAPGTGVLPGELTRLEYPLHPGQEWTIREEPFFGCRVDARERLDTPSGPVSCFRIRVTSALFGSEDVVWVWYGKEGLIGRYAHLESIMTDPTGEPGGTVVSEEGFFLSGTGMQEGSALDLPGGVALTREE